jgi:outer membrane protein, heavy metal efflux system
MPASATSTDTMRLGRRAIAALILLLPFARADGQGAASFALSSDPLLAQLIAQSLAARPELRQAEANARAERERIPQAGALPDPVLSLGIQNDGFGAIQVGKMETSFYQVMLSQGLPWPGKRGLRTEVARLGADSAGAALARARLTTEADVRRAYLDLLLTRDRLGLLSRLEQIWQTSAGVARVRYEAGDGAQSDVLRAQLELNRLRQRRWALEAQERNAVQTLNRLRGRPVVEPIVTSLTVRELALPELPAPDIALADALERSPELTEARLGAASASKAAALAERERYPDLGISAAVMPRGQLEPMWQAGISVGLPLWSSRKQSRAVAENQARAEAGARGAETIEQILSLRVAERQSAYAAIVETIRLFRGGLLVQSKATAESTLAQYRVGKVTFASVLEANAGYVGDEDAFLSALADAQRIAIAAAEVSLEPQGAAGAGGAMGGARVPGAGASGGAAMGSAPAAPAAGAPAAASPGM